MRKIIWLFGVLSGLLIGAGFFVNIGKSALNSSSSDVLRYALMFIVLGLAVYLSVRYIQQRLLSGEINFSRAFIIGFFIILIASVVYALMWEIYFINHGHDYVEGYLKQIKDRLDDSALGQLEAQTRFANQREIMESYEGNFIVRFGLTMAEIFPIGLLLALVNGIYYSVQAVRREKGKL